MSEYIQELITTAKNIATSGKGILAADESTGTIGKRFTPINLENNEENRRRYRELLFTTEGLEEYISGVILYHETLYQAKKDGTKFVDILKQKGIYIGIKVDLGVRSLRGTKGETFTQGFDDLDKRCKAYYEAGARFCKWRAVLKINKADGCPSDISIKENCNGLARYGAIAQDNGLVPIIEPEVLMDGDHDLEYAAQITQKVLAYTYKALHDANVLLEGTLLKPNMVCPGSSCTKKYSAFDIGAATATVLSRTVPPAVPGINFLSGGQSEEDASINLSAMNAIDNIKKPWNLSFSYGRALQASCIAVWKGSDDNLAKAQETLMLRAKANSQAAKGEYEGLDKIGASKEQMDAAKASLFVSGYVY